MIDNFIVTVRNKFEPESSADVFEKRGITLSLLKSVRDFALSMNSTPGYWTIGKVSAFLNGNHEILSPNSRWGPMDPTKTLTFADKTSLIEMLRLRYYDKQHPVLGVSYIETVGVKANIFISFAYTSDFVELVEAVECYLEDHPNRPRESTYFWFDLFVNNQWSALSKSFEWWATTFREAVEEIGETMLILQPWNGPQMLLRAWCLYEICCSKKISIGMSRKQLTDFYEALKTKTYDIVPDLGKIDLEKAEAYLKEDQEKIFAVVRAKEDGFHGFNVKITSLIRNWVSDALILIAAKIPDLNATLAELDELNKTSMVLKQQGNYNEAAVLAERVIKRCEEMGSGLMADTESAATSHFDALYLIALNNLAIIYRRQEKLDQSLSVFRRAIKAKERLQGPNHIDTLETVGNCSNTLRDLCHLGESRVMAERCLTGMRQYYRGEKHPALIQAIDRLANVISDQGELEEAQELYEEALRGYEEIGVHFPGYVDTLNNIAILYKNLEDFDAATAYYEKALKFGERLDGKDHPLTQRTRQNIENIKQVMADHRKDTFFASSDRSFAVVMKKILDGKTSAAESYKSSIQFKDHSQLRFHFLVDATLQYQRYLKYCSEILQPTVEQEIQMNDMKLTLNLNLAICYIKLENWKRVSCFNPTFTIVLLIVYYYVTCNKN